MGHVTVLDSLIGAHPSALCDLYGAGRPVDRDALAGELHGRMLGIPFGAAYMLTKPLVVGFARYLYPWRGKSFDRDGRGGHNFFVRGSGLPFRCESGPSELDGKPTLFILYDVARNPWPVSRMVDELRFVGERVLLGPSSLRTKRGPWLFAWWGLELAA